MPYIISTEIAGFKYFLRLLEDGTQEYVGLINNASVFNNNDELITDWHYNEPIEIREDMWPKPQYIKRQRIPFWQRLRFLRQQRRLSQQQIATGIGIKVSNYQAYELDRAFPPNDMLINIASFYSITIEELVKGKNVSQAFDAK